MSASHAIDIANKLMLHGAKADVPLAIIEQATTPHQQVHVTSLAHCNRDFIGKTFSSPSLMIIGKVVQLHTSFNWVGKLEVGTVFKQFI
jgi:siroheme synthase